MLLEKNKLKWVNVYGCGTYLLNNFTLYLGMLLDIMMVRQKIWDRLFEGVVFYVQIDNG